MQLVLVGFFGLGAFGLMCYHMSLMLSNQTTIEQLKSGNPVIADTHPLCTHHFRSESPYS
jgi:hypothetical protein